MVIQDKGRSIAPALFVFCCQLCSSFRAVVSAFLLGRAETVLAYSAKRANPIFGQILKCYVVILCRVVNITAYIAYIFIHNIILLFICCLEPAGAASHAAGLL